MKDKMLGWLKAGKEQVLVTYTNAVDIFEETFDELRTRYGRNPVLIMKFLLLGVSFVCLVLLIDLMFS
tara:strand:+ start:5754 stop:5957 length:204 start_codon:yes stop_codon:yes gene_type:complete